MIGTGGPIRGSYSTDNCHNPVLGISVTSADANTTSGTNMMMVLGLLAMSDEARTIGPTGPEE